MWCSTSGVGVCVVFYIVYVDMLYNVMGQAGMGLSEPLLLILMVEVF